MALLRQRMLSPLPVYLDEINAGRFAPRPSTLNGKVLGLLPNWRPSAAHVLTALGSLIEARYKLKDIVLAQPMHETPMSTGGSILELMREHLDDFARRVDVAIVATGD